MFEPSCVPYLNVLLYFVWLGGKRIAPRPQLLHIMVASNPLSSASQTDWRKCCLCQTDLKEELKSPPTHYPCSPESNGYSNDCHKHTTLSSNQPVASQVRHVPVE